MRALALPYSFLRHATRELGQHGAAWGGGWVAEVGALGSHRRGQGIESPQLHQQQSRRELLVRRLLSADHE